MRMCPSVTGTSHLSFFLRGTGRLHRVRNRADHVNIGESPFTEVGCSLELPGQMPPEISDVAEVLLWDELLEVFTVAYAWERRRSKRNEGAPKGERP
jgi:hypothetical protein